MILDLKWEDQHGLENRLEHRLEHGLKSKSVRKSVRKSVSQGRQGRGRPQGVKDSKPRLTMYSAKKILIEDAIRASPGRRLSHIANQFEVSRQRVHQIATRLRKTKTKTSEAL